MKKLWLLPALLTVALFASANKAAASPFTMDLDIVVTGDTPGGPTPYLSLTFTDVASGIVDVTFNAVNLVLSEFATTWVFNLDPTLDPTDLGITWQAGLTANSIDTGENEFNAAAGSEGYDIEFKFPTANSDDRLGVDGDFATYRFTLAGLTAADFDFQNFGKVTGPKDNPNPPIGPFYYTMAHIQGIGTNAGLSSWVASDGGFSDNEDPEDPPAVPEPASFALLGVGALALVARRYYTRK